MKFLQNYLKNTQPKCDETARRNSAISPPAAHGRQQSFAPGVEAAGTELSTNASLIDNTAFSDSKLADRIACITGAGHYKTYSEQSWFQKQTIAIQIGDLENNRLLYSSSDLLFQCMRLYGLFAADTGRTDQVLAASYYDRAIELYLLGKNVGDNCRKAGPQEVMIYMFLKRYLAMLRIMDNPNNPDNRDLKWKKRAAEVINMIAAIRFEFEGEAPCDYDSLVNESPFAATPISFV